MSFGFPNTITACPKFINSSFCSLSLLPPPIFYFFYNEAQSCVPCLASLVSWYLYLFSWISWWPIIVVWGGYLQRLVSFPELLRPSEVPPIWSYLLVPWIRCILLFWSSQSVFCYCPSLLTLGSWAPQLHGHYSQVCCCLSCPRKFFLGWEEQI